jgi:hypothetical protein
MSDHFSGPRAIAGPAGDICDVYAFPSPESPGRLVLVMTVLPQADAFALFSDGITCRFRLRRLTQSGTGFTFGTDELVVDCTFDAPQDGDPMPRQRGWCFPPAGEAVAFAVHDEQGGRGDGVRVFAGRRSDPFFMDVPAWRESVLGGHLAFKPVGTNSVEGFTVLGVVVELDVAPLLRDAGNALFAVVGETVAAGRLPLRIERVGRPEMKNVVLVWKEFDAVNRDLELRDLYNLEDAFHLGKDYAGAYRARINANLAVFDGLDGKTDWPLGADGAHPLTELLLADYLVVDLAKPHCENGFLEIERAVLEGREHTTCGGRSLNEDAMDTLYTLLIAGRGPRVADGVDHASVPAGNTFPYLAPPPKGRGQ